jgi:hypothetical protein
MAKESVIRRNLVVNTGGTTVFGAVSHNSAIRAAGDGIVVRDNDINTATRTGTGWGYGIFVSGEHGMVDDNRISRTDGGIQLTGTSKYRNNLTTNITPGNEFIGGINAGGNH